MIPKTFKENHLVCLATLDTALPFNPDLLLLDGVVKIRSPSPG